MILERFFKPISDWGIVGKTGLYLMIFLMAVTVMLPLTQIRETEAKSIPENEAVIIIIIIIIPQSTGGSSSSYLPPPPEPVFDFADPMRRELLLG